MTDRQLITEDSDSSTLDAIASWRIPMDGLGEIPCFWVNYSNPRPNASLADPTYLSYSLFWDGTRDLFLYSWEHSTPAFTKGQHMLSSIIHTPAFHNDRIIVIQITKRLFIRQRNGFGAVLGGFE